MTHKEEAKSLTAEAMHLYLQNEQNKLHLGRICKEIHAVKDGKPMYKHAGFDTFELWLKEVSELGRTQAYLLMDLHTKVSEKLPPEVIHTLPLNNALDLMEMSDSNIQNPAMIEAAQTMTNSNFKKHIDKVQPGLHLSTMVYKGFKIESADLPRVAAVLEFAKQLFGVKAEGACLMEIMDEWAASKGFAVSPVVETVEMEQVQ
jgi:hypothetical protein